MRQQKALEHADTRRLLRRKYKSQLGLLTVSLYTTKVRVVTGPKPDTRANKSLAILISIMHIVLTNAILNQGIIWASALDLGAR